jgi:hypothetical protein
MRPTQHQQDLGLVTRPPGAEPDPERLAPVRRPRGRTRGRRPDPGLEVRFDPRLELAEQLLHRSLSRPEPILLRQVHNLLEDVRADQQRPGVPGPRNGPADQKGDQNVPALVELDQLLLSMARELAADESTARAHRAKRIMEARRLLHRVDEEAADPHWPGGFRRRRLHEIINALSAPPGRD